MYIHVRTYEQSVSVKSRFT